MFGAVRGGARGRRPRPGRGARRRPMDADPERSRRRGTLPGRGNPRRVPRRGTHGPIRVCGARCTRRRGGGRRGRHHPGWLPPIRVDPGHRTRVPRCQGVRLYPPCTGKRGGGVLDGGAPRRRPGLPHPPTQAARRRALGHPVHRAVCSQPRGRRPRRRLGGASARGGAPSDGDRHRNADRSYYAGAGDRIEGAWVPAVPAGAASRHTHGHVGCAPRRDSRMDLRASHHRRGPDRSRPRRGGTRRRHSGCRARCRLAVLRKPGRGRTAGRRPNVDPTPVGLRPDLGRRRRRAARLHRGAEPSLALNSGHRRSRRLATSGRAGLRAPARSTPRGACRRREGAAGGHRRERRRRHRRQVPRRRRHRLEPRCGALVRLLGRRGHRVQGGGFHRPRAPLGARAQRPAAHPPRRDGATVLNAQGAQGWHDLPSAGDRLADPHSGRLRRRHRRRYARHHRAGGSGGAHPLGQRLARTAGGGADHGAAGRVSLAAGHPCPRRLRGHRHRHAWDHHPVQPGRREDAGLRRRRAGG
ncbi:hypothetical protein BGCPKDLD_5209 [Methylorubrum suomiense]|uniref:Uncharacterized protein n=1 Tax=Methylorubrum suomiense TaxID=144191 RepID=A0ABQ4V8F0_9HYPH|nr:hypothetical protein BGCPKDLD_5209 [Methylorubrum suomiense]